MPNLIVSTIIDQFMRSTTAAGALSSIDSSSGSYNLGSIPGETTVSVDANNGSWQYGVVAEGDIELAAPTSGSEGKKVTIALQANGKNRLIYKTAALNLPTETAVTFPVTILNSNTRWFSLVHTSGLWCIASVSGTYPID